MDPSHQFNMYAVRQHPGISDRRRPVYARDTRMPPQQVIQQSRASVFCSALGRLLRGGVANQRVGIFLVRRPKILYKSARESPSDRSLSLSISQLQ